MNEIIAAIEMPKRTIDKTDTTYLRKAAWLFMQKSAVYFGLISGKSSAFWSKLFSIIQRDAQKKTKIFEYNAYQPIGLTLRGRVAHMEPPTRVGIPYTG